MSLHLWHCQDCGSEFQGNQPSFCSGCMSERAMLLVPTSRNGIVYGSGNNRPEAKRLRPLEKAKTVFHSFSSSKKYDWGCTGFLLPISARVNVQGLPGCGKSTFARRAALSLSSLGIPVCLISTEEGLDSDTFVNGFERAKSLLRMYSYPTSLSLAYASSPSEILYYRSEWLSSIGSLGVLIVDSAYVHGGRDNHWYKTVSEDERHGLLTVHHLTTSGAPRGGLTSNYLGDAVVSFTPKGAEVTKNRYGPCSSFDVHNPVSLSEEDLSSNVLIFPKRVSHDIT